MTNAVSKKKKFEQRFIVSDSNRLAYTMAMNTLDHPGPVTSPLLICGGIGTGKTHLLKSLEQYVHMFHPDKKVKLITAERYKIDLMQTLTQRRERTLIEIYKDLDVLLVDEIQGFIHHGYAQMDFVKVIKLLLHEGKAVIFTSDRIPNELKKLESSLISLVTGNLIVALETPDETLKKQVALQRAFHTAHKDLPADTLEVIVNYLASKEDYDLRRLTGSMQRVILLSELTGEELSLEFAKRVGV